MLDQPISDAASPGPAPTSVPTGWQDDRVALMIQEMTAFGSRAGEAERFGMRAIDRPGFDSYAN